MRERRWDYLYDRQIRPVKEYVLERFAEELARELGAWPPPSLEWANEAERARFRSGAEVHPRDDVFRLALEVVRLELAREFEQIEVHLAHEGHRLQSPDEEAAVQLVSRLVTEACMELKERAERIPLSRADLVAAVDEVERRLFRVTLS